MSAVAVGRFRVDSMAMQAPVPSAADPVAQGEKECSVRLWSRIAGNLELVIQRPEVWRSFVVGSEYDLTFTPVTA